jgi:hypothetical protein
MQGPYTEQEWREWEQAEAEGELIELTPVTYEKMVEDMVKVLEENLRVGN